jgi:hypothetical protein
MSAPEFAECERKDGLLSGNLPAHSLTSPHLIDPNEGSEY